MRVAVREMVLRVGAEDGDGGGGARRAQTASRGRPRRIGSHRAGPLSAPPGRPPGAAKAAPARAVAHTPSHPRCGSGRGRRLPPARPRCRTQWRRAPRPAASLLPGWFQRCKWSRGSMSMATRARAAPSDGPRRGGRGRSSSRPAGWHRGQRSWQSRGNEARRRGRRARAPAAPCPPSQRCALARGAGG